MVGVGDEVEQGRLADVARHLERHAVTAAVSHIPTTAGTAVAADLLAEARRLGADLIVTGAFGRGPLAQRLWGGMTSGLQNDADLSWLLSH